MKLSRRETDIVRLLGSGASNKQIAAELSLTVGTVKEYMHTLFEKCGVSNRTALALMFFEGGRHENRARFHSGRRAARPNAAAYRTDAR